MTDRWTERLSEYLDGELPAADRNALEAHLPGCAGCTEVLQELRAVAARAGSLDDRPPAHDLWPGVAARIGVTAGQVPSRRRVLAFRRVTLSVPQLVAAALALVIGSGVVVSRWAGTGSPAVAVTPAESTGVAESFVSFGGARYDSAVVGLERSLAEGRSRLDTATVRIIEENLAIIDQAIEQARRALAADPGSVYLNNHLAGTLRRKVDLLRRMSQLSTVQS
jgi:anti-sigma factor RsiW